MSSDLQATPQPLAKPLPASSQAATQACGQAPRHDACLSGRYGRSWAELSFNSWWPFPSAAATVCLTIAAQVPFNPAGGNIERFLSLLSSRVQCRTDTLCSIITDQHASSSSNSESSTSGTRSSVKLEPHASSACTGPFMNEGSTPAQRAGTSNSSSISVHPHDERSGFNNLPSVDGESLPVAHIPSSSSSSSSSSCDTSQSPEGCVDKHHDAALTRSSSSDKLPSTPERTWLSPDAIDGAKVMLCGGIAGALAKTATAPMSRLTILYQVQALPSYPSAAQLQPHQGSAAHAGRASARPAPGILYALSHLVRHEGVLALWRGNLATVLHRLPYSATNFLVYETAAKQLSTANGSNVTTRLLAGGLSGLVACTAAYPLDLLRTRLAAQTGLPQSGQHTGMAGMVTQIVKAEGLAGMYRGLGATLTQVVPSLALNFTLYDSCKHALLGKDSCHSPSPAASLVCACASALGTSTLVFPLDVIRRNIQVRGPVPGNAAPAKYWAVACELYGTRGPRGLYNGLLSEYSKVVPGMAIAFVTYEHLKRQLGVRKRDE